MKKKDKIKYFVKKTYQYQKQLGLLGYEIHIFKHKSKKGRAYCSCEKKSMIASISYNVNWIKKPINKKQINRVAFHEICEILLFDIKETLNLHLSINKANKYVHQIIRAIENIHFGNDLIKKPKKYNYG